MMLHPDTDQKSQFRHLVGFPRDGVAISNEKIRWVLLHKINEHPLLTAISMLAWSTITIA